MLYLSLLNLSSFFVILPFENDLTSASLMIWTCGSLLMTATSDPNFVLFGPSGGCKRNSGLGAGLIRLSKARHR